MYIYQRIFVITLNPQIINVFYSTTSFILIIEQIINDNERSRVLAANKYARSICSLDEKTIPRLMTMEKILRDQEYSLSYKQEEENTSRSNEFDSE